MKTLILVLALSILAVTEACAWPWTWDLPYPKCTKSDTVGSPLCVSPCTEVGRCYKDAGHGMLVQVMTCVCPTTAIEDADVVEYDTPQCDHTYELTGEWIGGAMNCQQKVRCTKCGHEKWERCRG